MTEYFDYHRFVVAWAISAARIGVAFMVCPAFGESILPGLVRRAAVLAFSLLVVPHVLAGMPAGEMPLWAVAGVVAKEAVVGFTVGFFSAIPFWVAENVGNLIDNQRGATMGEIYSPLSGSQESTTGTFFSHLVSVAFFVSGAVMLMLGALYASFEIYPVFAGGLEFAADAPLKMLGAVDGLLRTTVVISAPVVILMLLATLGLGLVNRTAPQLNVFFLSMPVKSALGVAMLVVYLPFVMDKLLYADAGAVLSPAMRILSP